MASSRPPPQGPSPKVGAEIEETALLDLEEQRHKGDGSRRASATQKAGHALISSYVSRRIMNGCAILFPLVVTIYVTWWFLEFFDNFFSPVYEYLFGFHVFGLGFMTSMLFIFGTGVFMSSYAGNQLLGVGELIIRKLPIVKHVYSAAKQVSAAVSPDNEAAHSFRECVVVKHPRHGEYAFGFITGQTTLQMPGGDMTLYVVYIPTNHVYVGDIFLLAESEIIRNNLSVREGLEIIVSVGMATPATLYQVSAAAPPPK